MKNKTITRKISQGMYVLTTKDGGCVVDAVSQVSAGDNPYISVAVMKSNYTCELMQKNNEFALSVLDMNVSANIIKTFGMHSMRDYDKFSHVDLLSIEDHRIIKESVGYMICEKVDQIDTGTHILFIGRLIHADKFNDNMPMTYGYYQEHKDELIKVETKEGKTAWVCKICNYVVYAETLDDDFICPKCGAPKEMFEKKEI